MPRKTFILTIILTSVFFVLPQVTQAATYYLDANNGSDTNPGTSALPWKTLPRAMTSWTGTGTKVTNGDTIKLRNGNYGNFAENNIQHTDWITYEADSGQEPIFSSIRAYSNTGQLNSFLRFRGITVYHGGALVRNVKYVQFYDGNFIGNGYSTAVPYVSDNYNFGINLHNAAEVVIDGCNISGDGDPTPMLNYVGHIGDINGPVGGVQGSEGGYGRGYFLGIYFEAPSVNVTINNCDIGSNNTAIAGAARSGITISNNNIHHVTTDFITIGSANPTGSGLTAPIIIENNHIHDGIELYYGRPSYPTPLTDFSHVDAIQAGGFAAGVAADEVNHLIIRKNIIHHSDGDAMFLRGAMKAPWTNTDWVVENNLVYDMLLRYIDRTGIMIRFHNANDITFRNNTVTMGGVESEKDAYAVSPTVFTNFHNNIIAYLKLNTDAGMTIVKSEDNNIIFSDKYGMGNYIFGPNTTRFYSYRDTNKDFTKFKALFNSYDNNDFTLAPGSIAINFGNVSYAPATDILGNPRVGAPDVGAYEYQGTVTPPPVTPPSVTYGDINADGSITASDALLATQYSLGLITLTPDQITKADVSGNGSVTVYDAALILQKIAGVITKFPVEN